MSPALEAAPGLHLRRQEAIDVLVTETAIAGFVGISERGPIGVPQPLLGFGEYLQVFGQFIRYGHLAESIHAFFQNGGEKCWVVRAANQGSKFQTGPCPPADRLAKAAFGSLPDAQGNAALDVEALDEGSWGNEVAFAIDEESTRDMVLTTLRAPVAETDLVLKVESALDIRQFGTIQLTQAGNAYVQSRHRVASVDTVNHEITIDDPAGAVFSTGSSVAGRGFRMAIRYRDDLEVFDELSMTPEHPRYVLQVINGDANQPGYIEKRERGHSILVRVAHLRPGGLLSAKPERTPALDGSDAADPHSLSGGGDGFLSARVEFPSVAGPGVMRLFARQDRGTEAHDLSVTVAPFETRTALTVPIVPGGSRDQVTVSDAETLFVGDNLTLSFTDADGTISSETRQIQTVQSPNSVSVSPAYLIDFPAGSAATVQDHFDILVHRGNAVEPVERRRNLSGDPAHPRFYPVVLETTTSLNEPPLLCSVAPGMPVFPSVGSKPLAGGRDPGTLNYRLYTGYAADGELLSGPLGLGALETVTEVCVVAMPDLHRVAEDEFVPAQRDILHHCDRAGSRFALLDPPPPDGIDSQQAEEERLLTIESWPLNFRTSPVSKNGALYFPWVTGSFEGELRTVAPSGFIAGHIADSDRRRGVGKAPANARLKGIVDLSVSVDREAQARLNPMGVNCIRKFENGQIRLFGARTLSDDTRWTFINVRRVLLSVIKALSHNLLWAVFEPNDSRLYRRVESTLRTYLSSLVAKGLTGGTSSEESFYVKCNAETNPSEVRDAGQVIAEIGLAIASPAEFIVLTARRTPEAMSIVEEDV